MRAAAHASLERAEKRGVRAVAVFEAGKGLIAMVVAFGLAQWLHANADRVAAWIIHFFRLNPASQLPHEFLASAHKFTEIDPTMLVLAASVYASMRFVEAYGLWRLRPWARWFAVAALAAYVPLEIYETARSASLPHVSLLAFNVGLVVFLLAARGAFRPTACVAA